MKFLKAYIKALLIIAAPIGILYLGLMFAYSSDILITYLVYICSVAALGGPFRMMLEGNKS